MGRPTDLPAIGAAWAFDEADWLWAEVVGGLQHNASGSRGSRDAGANLAYRVRGAAGEIAVARLIGIMPQVRAEPSPSGDPDIETPQHTLIEVKTGVPLVWRRTLQRARWYVAGDLAGRVWTCRRVASGAEVLAARITPPAHWCPRPGTADQNWVIPADRDETC